MNAGKARMRALRAAATRVLPSMRMLSPKITMGGNVTPWRMCSAY